MIYRKVHINKWTAHFYFAIQHYWIEEIEGKMQSLGASRKVLDRVVRNMRKNEASQWKEKTRTKIDTAFITIL